NVAAGLRLNPNKRSTRQQIEERNQIRIRQVNAPAGTRFAYRGLVGGAVDVNIALVRIHIAAAIDAGFQAFEPQDARGDFGIGEFRLRDVADDFARLENSSGRFARANFFSNAMQSQWRAIRAFLLPDAKARGGAGELLDKLTILKQ